MFNAVVNGKTREQFEFRQDAYNFLYTFCQTLFLSERLAIFDPEAFYLAMRGTGSYWPTPTTFVCIREVTIPTRKDG